MSKNISVLIVEDSENDAELILRQFRINNYDITSKRVETAFQMQTALEETSWDLVIADYNLPEFDAPSALKVLQKSDLDIPFIVVSGTIGEGTAVAMMKAGAHDYIMKNNLPRLIPAVNRELNELQTRLAKQQTDKEIRRAAEEWIRTFDSITDLVSIQDLDYRFIKVNQSYAQAFNINPYALIGQHCYEVFHGTTGPIADCPHDKMVSTQKPVIQEILEPHLGIYLEVTVSPIFDANGTLTGSVHVAKNITDRKRAEERLKESEEQLRSIFENSIDAILLAAPDGSILAANPAACSMFERSEEELRRVGKAGIIDLTDPQWADALEERKQTGLYRKEHYHIRKDGTRFPTEVSSNIFLDKDGNKRIIVIIRDITTRKKTEKELVETTEKLRKSLTGTLQLISQTVEIRDPYTAGHQRRVSALARSIAQEMGLSQTVTNAIRMAGAIHDIGKMSVPADILSRPSKLSEMEMDLVKTHPRIGYDILKDSELSDPVAEIVLQHHERLDGSGYPQGLKGDRILLEAQIVAAADVVETMASHRPYRPAFGIDAALEEIEKNMGTLYNPEVARACLRLFREKNFSFV